MMTLLCLASKAAQCLVTAIPERPILLKKGKNLAVFTTESWLFRSQNLVTQLVFSYNVILIITTKICDLSPIFLDLSVGSKVRQEFPKPCGIHQKCQKSMLSLQKSWEWDSSYTAVVATHRAQSSSSSLGARWDPDFLRKNKQKDALSNSATATYRKKSA